MWMLPLYLHVNQKSDNDDDDMIAGRYIQFKNVSSDSSAFYSQIILNFTFILFILL